MRNCRKRPRERALQKTKAQVKREVGCWAAERERGECPFGKQSFSLCTGKKKKPPGFFRWRGGGGRPAHEKKPPTCKVMKKKKEKRLGENKSDRNSLKQVRSLVRTGCFLAQGGKDSQGAPSQPERNPSIVWGRGGESKKMPAGASRNEERTGTCRWGERAQVSPRKHFGLRQPKKRGKTVGGEEKARVRAIDKKEKTRSWARASNSIAMGEGREKTFWKKKDESR